MKKRFCHAKKWCMSKTVAEQWCDILAADGQRQLYSLAGECDNVLMETLHREKRWKRRTELQQEDAAVLAASAGARLTGETQVCYAGCLPGLYRIRAAMAEAAENRDRLLVLGVLPSDSSLSDGPEGCCRAEIVQYPEEAVPTLAEALRRTDAGRGPVLLLIREEVAGMPAGDVVCPPRQAIRVQPLRPHPADVAEMASILNESERTVFLCGGGCEGAREELLLLAQRLQAPVVFTMAGKQVVEGDNDLAIGMTGIMGWGAAPAAVMDCGLLVMWGTDFPYPEYLPAHGNVVQVDSDPAALGRRCRLRLAVAGDVREVARELLPLVKRGMNDDFATAMRSLHRRELARSEQYVRNTDDRLPLRPELVTRVVSDHAEPDAVFCVEVGAPMLWCARYLHPSGKQRLTGAFRSGLGESALPMGIGVKSAYPSRQVVAVCTAEGVLRHLNELLTLQREHLSLKILVLQRLLPDSMRIDRAASSAPFSVAEVAAAMGLKAGRIHQAQQIHHAVRSWLAESEASLLEAVVDAHAMSAPPEVMVRGENGQHRLVNRAAGEHFIRIIYGNRRFLR